MLLPSMDVWNIVDGSKEPPPSNADPKMLREYQRRVKNAMSIIGFNLVDNQLAHIKSCKRPVEVWKTLCNIHEMKSLSNIFFIRRKFFTCKMQKDNNLLHHVNKVKAFADQLVCLKIPMRDEYIVMVFLESFPTSSKYLITAIATILMKEFTMDQVTVRLMHEISKRKEKAPKVRMPP